MARKDLLKGLIEDATQPPAPPDLSGTRVDTARPRYSGGAIGAVSQSIAQLKSRAIVDLDPSQISNAGVDDRLDHDEADHAALVASIRDHGQQVPVLVRPHPQDEGRFQVVYGRRRVRALRDLNLTVKALVRDLDDRALIVAQGQENTARKDLSFIEKANFARQMRDQGYERPIICAALHVDKTVISRMLSVIDRLPDALIRAIGSAPSVGRDRWLALADLIEGHGMPVDKAISIVSETRDDATSDNRFAALMAALSVKEAAPRPAPVKTSLTAPDGRKLGMATQKGARTLIDLQADGFDRWLIDNITEIHRSWETSRDE